MVNKPSKVLFGNGVYLLEYTGDSLAFCIQIK